MTLRRLNVLVDGLPGPSMFGPGALVWRSVEAKTAKTKVDRLRERQAFYDKQRAGGGDA